jgi:pimeloyl-ACP methyl ester carboxylesterase
MRRIRIGTGIELAVREYGEGDPVLLLHAWGETHRTFDRLVPLLPPTWRIVVPDLRGAGDSDKPADGYSLVDCAADVVGLLDALGLESAWLVGSSSGGYVAQQVALDHPDRLRGMVLVGSPRSLAGLDPFGDVLAAFHDPVVPADIEALNGELPLKTPVPAEFLADQDRAALSIPKHVWLSAYRGLMDATPPTDAGTLPVRTLLLRGGADDLLPTSQADDLLAAIPGSRCEVYDGTGHLVLWEQPERVAADLVSFVTVGP